MTPTQIALRNLDPHRGGRAELTIDAPEIVPARLSVSIRRGTQNKGFLGPAGWQQAEHLFLAQSFREAGDRLVLVLGPDVVDNELRDFDVVEMTFPEVGMVGQVVWEGITRSVQLIDEPPGGAGGGGGTQGGTTAGGPGEGPPGGPGTTGPGVTGTGGTGTGPGTTGTGSPGTGSTGTGPGITGTGTTGPGLSRGALLAGLLALLLIAAALVWLKPWAPGPERDDVAAPAPDPEPVPDPEPTPGDDPAEAPTADPAPARDPMDAALESGRAAIASGDCAAAQTALRPGVEAGHGPTLLLWAEQQDSVGFAPCLTETANDVRALTNYQKACEAGTPDAMPALQALVDDLTRRAGQGDPVAEDVLRVAVPKAVAACTP